MKDNNIIEYGNVIVSCVLYRSYFPFMSLYLDVYIFFSLATDCVLLFIDTLCIGFFVFLCFYFFGCFRGTS